MHISHSENSGGVYVNRITMSERIWQFVRFSVVTGMIFAISFFLLNFQAYKQIITTVLNPEAQAKAEEVLNASSGATVITDQSKLLPVLPDRKEVNKTFSWMDSPIAPTDNRLIIPKLGTSTPVVNMSTVNIEGEDWTELEKQIQDGLKNGVVHYPGTASPGQFGNFFLTGHSSYYPWAPGQFKDVFALLGKLDIGDEFYVYYNQKKYAYKIYDKLEVQPENVDVLTQPQEKKMATLMTCTPVGTALRRLIIKADEI